MKHNISHNTQAVAIFLVISAGFLFGFADALQAQLEFEYARLQPIEGNLSAPTAVALDPYGNMYVTESSNNRLLIYRRNGVHIKTLRGLDKPISVAVNKDRKIFIGNAGRQNVEVYNRRLTLRYKLGFGDGEFTRPTGIAVDSYGNAYIVDSKEHTIKVYNADGSYKFSFGNYGNADGQFNFPIAIAIHELSGEIIVSDLQVLSSCTYEVARIQIFDLDGVFKRSFGTCGQDSGPFTRPLGVTVGNNGWIYVTDAYQNAVQAFDSYGAFVGILYDLDNPMRTPLGIAIDKKTSRLYIASLNTSRVEVYEVLSATDRQRPVVTITSPTNRSTVSGTVTITVEASDNVGIARVIFFVDRRQIGQDMTAPYGLDWNTMIWRKGRHKIIVKAFDLSGNKQRAKVKVKVAN